MAGSLDVEGTLRRCGRCRGRSGNADIGFGEPVVGQDHGSKTRERCGAAAQVQVRSRQRGRAEEVSSVRPSCAELRGPVVHTEHVAVAR